MMKIKENQGGTNDWGMTEKEYILLQKLSSPEKIQDFLDMLPRNNEKSGHTCASPRVVLREKKAHCIEGAYVAALALWIHGERPLLLDLKASHGDDDHVVALYKRNGYWGAVSKTNHPVLRFRDPVYRTIRELALSYFHEYFLLSDGRKTLRSYSRPFSLKRFGTKWITEEDDLWEMASELDQSKHYPLVPPGNERYLRPASDIELTAAGIAEWPLKDPRT